MSIYRVRIYTPHFPFPPQAGPSQVIYEQARRYASSGYDTELVFWKTPPAEATRRLRSPHPKGFDDRIRLTYLPNPVLERVELLDWEAKVERASFSMSTPPQAQPSATGGMQQAMGKLLSPLTPAEVDHYPPELDQRERLKPVSLAIYHSSFAYNWLNHQKEAVKKLETDQIVHVHELESDRVLEKARSAPLLERPGHQLKAAKLWSHEKALAGLVSELWFVSPADFKRYESRVPEAPVKLVPAEFDPDLSPV